MLNAVLIGVTFLIIIGLAVLFHTCLKVTPEEGYASSIMTIMLLIYVAGLLGNAKYALYIIYLLSAIGFVAGIVDIVRNGKTSIKTFFSPAIVMLFLILLIGMVAFKGFMICGWDELYQWGKCANYMVEFDRFPQIDDFSGEAALLSSTTFFHYYFARISAWIMGKITESNYYVSNLVLWFSALVLPFSGCAWKDWKRVAFYGVFHFLLTAVIFVQPYYNIYTDQATAYWSGCLIAWMLLGKNNKKNAYLIPMILINVGFMKSMVGPLFAVIVIMAIIIMYFSSRKEQGLSVLPDNWKRLVFSKRGIIVILAVFCPFVLVGIWSAISGGHGFWRFRSMDVVEGQGDRAILTLKAMIGWIFKSVTLREDRLFLSYGMFIVFTLCIVYVLYPFILDKRELHIYRSVMTAYVAGFAAFFLIMYIAFMTVFGYYASITALSLNRYYSDYMMLGIVPLTMPLFTDGIKDADGLKHLLKNGIVFVLIIGIIYSSSDYFLTKLSHAYAVDTKRYYRREQMASYCDKVKELTGGEGKIYFINQKRTGLLTLAADYDMGDQLSRGGMCYKFREDTSEEISGMVDYPIDSLPLVLEQQGYEYLWVYTTDSYFTEHAKELFHEEKIKNGYFYKVLHGENGIVLEYLGKIK